MVRPDRSGSREDTALTPTFTLADLGWSDHFARQLDPSETGQFAPARITTVHRDRVLALSEAGPLILGLPPDMPTSIIAVGDWVLADTDASRVHRLLDRTSLIARRGAGTGAERQLIGANIDTLAIVTSCNAEFNTARLERYLALARSGEVDPLIVLTKADNGDAARFIDLATVTGRGTPVLALDARDIDTAAAALAAYCGRGRTLGLVGSSGVGKSTLAGSLTGLALDTGAIREDDAKGRHTTTARHLIPTLGGGWLMDTPGMRELRLTDAAEAIAATYDDIDALARTCRFADCAHDQEPGCAVQAAVAAGDLDMARLQRWNRLMLEDRRNSETLFEARARSRAFGRKVRSVQAVRRDKPKR